MVLVSVIKLGMYDQDDTCTTYFQACLRNRQAQNYCNRLMESNRDILTAELAIEQQVTSFYKSLLGTTTSKLPVVHTKVIKNGYVINKKQQKKLVKPITLGDVQIALMGIIDKKALGYDGLDEFFFKKAWCMIGYNIIECFTT